jgi:hypothetical protein
VKAGWFALMGGWCRRTALSPVVLKLNAKSPDRQPGTSMYDCVDVKVTTYFCVSVKTPEISIGTNQNAIFHSLASTHSSGPRVTRPWLEESRVGCCMKNISVMPRWLFDLYVDSSDNHFGAPESQLQS